MTERMAPMDEFSNLPLPLIPTELPENNTFNASEVLEYDRWDLHHPFHPNYMLVTEGQRVVRHSRVQFLPRYTHCRYHQFYDGVQLPQTANEEFAVGVLAVAGYVPDKAVDVSGKQPKIVSLDPHQRIQLGETIWPETRKFRGTGRDRDRLSRGCFFMTHIINQSLDHVWPSVMHEFLETKDESRKQHLGFLILAKAMERASEPVNETYRTAHAKGLIPSGQPKGVVRVVQKIARGYETDYFGTLRRRVEQVIA